MRTPAASSWRASFLPDAAIGLALIAAGCGQAPAPMPPVASPVAAAVTTQALRLWFADRSHFVAADDPSLRGWRICEVDASDETSAGGVVFAADRATDKADGSSRAIHMTVRRWPHVQQVAGADAPVRQVFKSWGKSVAVADCMELCTGFWGDWRLSSRDVLTERSVKPQAVVVGPARTWARAIATDRRSNSQERRDWYCWSTTQPFTYVAEFVTTDPEWRTGRASSTPIEELMKSILTEAVVPNAK